MMTEPGSAPSPRGREGEADTRDLIESARLVWRYKWMITGLCLVATMVTAVLMVWSPKIYESTASVIASREGAGAGMLGGLAVAAGALPQVPIPGLSIPSLTPNRDLLVGVLKSRSLAQATVERFGLKERYGSRFLEEAVEVFQGRTRVSVSKEGVISVRVEDTNPELAAEIANFNVAQLDKRVAQYGVGEAGRQHTFLIEQLSRAKAQLDRVEEAYRRFQERNRAIVLQDQTRGAIETAARLKGEIMASEIQLQVMRGFATDANPEVVAIKRRIEELNRHLGQMQYGDRANGASGSRDFSVPFARVPELGIELARLTRDVKVQETLVAILAQQAEQSRIAEAKDMPSVMVLDPAVPAERPSRPRVRLNTAIAAIVSLVGAVALAFLVEAFRNVRRQAQAEPASLESGV